MPKLPYKRKETEKKTNTKCGKGHLLNKSELFFGICYKCKFEKELNNNNLKNEN